MGDARDLLTTGAGAAATAFGGPLVGGLATSLIGGLFGGGDTKAAPSTSYVNPFTAGDGLFNTSFQDGNINLGLGDQMQGAQQGLMGQYGQQVGQTAPQAQQMSQLGTDFLGSMGAYNPQQIAQQQYNLLSPQLLQQQQQGMLDMESRQFAQGRLGSTGGAQDFGEMQQANMFANNQLMSNAFAQGMQGQQQQASLGQQFSQGAPQLQGLYNQLPASLLAQLGGIQGQGINLLEIGGGLNQVAGQGMPNYSLTEQMGQGLIQSGVEQFGQGVEGLFNQQPTYMPPKQPSVWNE